jgi:biotin carboxyl carrier protein
MASRRQTRGDDLMPTTTYEVTIDGRSFQVHVRSADEGTFVRVDDGEEALADLQSVRNALHALRVDTLREEVLAAMSQPGQVRLTLRGWQYSAEVVDEAHARLASVAGGRAGGHAHVELKAPMPGLLVRLLCTVGDEVTPGQPLAVLQAMKMENELSLPRGGTVAAVNAEAGTTVEQGQVLVVLA